MTIEEAIEILKQEPDFSLRYYIRENAIDVLLTAYEKQQKEIEELKIIEKLFHNRIEEIEPEIFISKDKIKELIKEKAMTDTYNFKTIAVKDIEELLGE